MARNLYLIFWDGRGYMSTNRRKLKSFAHRWRTGQKVKCNNTTTWTIPRVERTPSWIPAPLVMDKIEYGKK